MADLHYNAFISYRHNERDSRIAGNIQRELERFHIPAAIRKSSGIRRFERIFRDKEELPITIDLGDNIDQALTNSDFLIVICSPELLESRWCMREIELFLSKHPRSHVLTVLTKGEPDEVIPEALLSEKRQVTQEDGTVVEEIYESEPLSCDYREAAKGDAKALRKANREELPRLAACMLGCAYDELVRRQHQYRMRRLITASSVAAALMITAISYLLWSRNAIHNQYIETLRSQSVNLAGESLALLDSDDRIGALQLALAALPDEKIPDRPVTPKALYAVSEALGAYKKSDDKVCTWIYSAYDDVNSFAFSEDGKYLLAMDKSGKFFIFDAESKERVEVWEIYDQDNIPGFIPVGEQQAIVWRNGYIFAMDYIEGKQLWTQALDFIGMNAMLADTADGPALFVENSDSLLLLDPVSGDILSKYTMTENVYGKSWFDGNLGMAVSPDGNLFACVRRYNAGNDFFQMTVSVWNRKTGTLAELPISLGRVDALCFSGNDEIVLCGRDDPYQYGDMARSRMYIDDTPLQIIGARVGKDELSVLWTTSRYYAQEPATFVLETVPYLGSEDQVLAAFAGTVVLLDRNTGDPLIERQVAGNIVSKLYNSDDALTLVSEEGQKIVFTYGPGSIYYQNAYKDGLETAVFQLPATEYALRNGKIYCYEQIENPNFQELAASQKILYTPMRESLVCGSVTALLVQEPAVILTDTESGAVKKVPLEGDIFDWALLGALPEGQYGCPAFLMEGPDPESDGRIFSVLLADGSMVKIADTENAGTAGDGLFLTMGHSIGEAGGRFYYTDRDSCKSILCLSTGKDLAPADRLQEISFSNLEENLVFLRIYRKDLITDGKLYLPSPVYPAHKKPLVLTTALDTQTGTNALLIADLEKGSVLKIDNIPSDGLLRAAWKEDDSLVAVTGDKAFFILDSEGNKLHTVPQFGRRVADMYYLGDDLLVLYSDHTLVRYDQDVNTLSETTLQYTEDYSGLEEQVRWTLEAPYLYLQIDDEMNILDTRDWTDTPVAAIPNAIGFVPETGLLCIAQQKVDLLEEQGIYWIGTFPHFTAQQLIDWANEELNGLEPDEEMRARYGLR